MIKCYLFLLKIISPKIRLYHRLNRSYHDIEGLIAERGDAVSYKAICLPNTIKSLPLLARNFVILG